MEYVKVKQEFKDHFLYGENLLVVKDYGEVLLVKVQLNVPTLVEKSKVERA